MKSLLERAKPQLIEALENLKAEYPLYGGEVEKALAETPLVGHLRYTHIMDIDTMWRKSTGEYFKSPWECFEELEK